VFDVYLPVCGEEAVTDINVRTEEGLSGNGERILVVEDQEKVRSFAVTILKEQNYTVFEAGSAEEAIRIFEEEEGKFDLLFSDVVLPGMSGLDLLDTLRSRSGWLKVLLTTGYTEQKLQLDIIRERGYEILHKPYSMDELLSGIQGVLSKGN
jgi:DNA-binding NtrC family response regulator